MSTKVQRMLTFRDHYKRVKNVTEVDSHKLALFAQEMGWELPKPKEPIELLATLFSRAIGEEVRIDKKTKRPYKASLAILHRQGSQQMTLWVDVDEAPRNRVVRGLHYYREQMVGEAAIAKNTADHWNSIHPNEEPVTVELDLAPDVLWRENAVPMKVAS